jgi:hypothetical protein
MTEDGKFPVFSLTQLVTLRDYIRRGHTIDNLHIDERGILYFKDGSISLRMDHGGNLTVKDTVWTPYLTRHDLKIGKDE